MGCEQITWSSNHGPLSHLTTQPWHIKILHLGHEQIWISKIGKICLEIIDRHPLSIHFVASHIAVALASSFVP